MTASSTDLFAVSPGDAGMAAADVAGRPMSTAFSARFCTACGRPCTADSACMSCSTPRLKQATASRPRRLSPAITLYFLLLGLLIVSSGFKSTPLVDLVTSGLMTVMVGCFAIAMRSELKDAMSRAAWNWTIAAIFLAPLTYAIATSAVQILDNFFAVPALDFTSMYLDLGVRWPVIILVVCVQPAVVEELAFRGIIFAALQRVMGPVETIVVSALMFMTLHMSPVNAPHLFIMGLALGYLRYRSKSILPGVALHFLHNLLCTIA